MKKQLKIVMQGLRRYPFSALCILLIWVLSLTPFFPETPLDDVEFIDKWTHLVMYGGTSLVVWLEYYRRHRSPLTAHLGRLWLWAGVGLSLMGGLLELLQAYCTMTRSGEWLDFGADSVGALGVCLVGSVVAFFVKRPSRH